MVAAWLAVFVTIFVLLMVLAATVLSRRRQRPRRRPTTEGGSPNRLPEMNSAAAASTTAPAAASTTAPAASATAATSLDWPTRCYPATLARDAVAVARAARGFGPIDAVERARLTRAAESLREQHETPWFGYEHLASIRNQEVALRAGHSGARAFREAPALAAESAAGATVVEIARRHNLPPMAVLRAILVERGHSERRVREMLASPETLPDGLAAQAAAAAEADLGSRLNADRIRARSDAAELAVERRLRAAFEAAGAKVTFQTERDLRAIGAALTPDFLFGEPVRINGATVRWLDVKDYSLYGGRLVAASLRKQAEKYTRAFGPGAMVFVGGVACGCAVAASPPPLLLDGSAAN